MKIDSSAVSLQAASVSKQTAIVTAASITTVTKGQRDVTKQDVADMLKALEDSKGKYDPGNKLLQFITDARGSVKSDDGSQTSLTDLGRDFARTKKRYNDQQLKQNWNTNLAAGRTRKTRNVLAEMQKRQESLEMNLLKMMLEAMTGKKFKDDTFKAPPIAGESDDCGILGGWNAKAANAPEEGEVLAPAPGASPARNAGTYYQTSISYVSAEYSMQQSYSFNASAIVNTADGKQINVALELNMSSAVYSKFEMLSVSSQALKDPLVINFAASSAELTDTKFRFDLDADGSSYQISSLKSGSGFLALDLYGDGSVRDGSQLFGVQSGDGFADLARHDGDGNGWIDENDEIFDKLRIWHVDDSGSQRLVGLGEMGIGAIFLGSAAADYMLFGDSANPDMNGMIRSGGIFLREDGTAGTMQHVDLKI